MKLSKPFLTAPVLLMIPCTAWAATSIGLQGKRFLLFLGILFIVAIYLLIAKQKINKPLGWSLLAGGVIYVIVIAAFILNTISLGLLFGEYYGLENPYPAKSHLHKPYEHFAERLMAEPKYKAYYKKAKRGIYDKRAVYYMVSDGLKKVDEGLVDKYINTITAVVNAMDQAHCATLMKGRDEDGEDFSTAFNETLEKLEEEYINDWFDMAYGAVMAQVNGSPNITVKRYAFETAFNKLIDIWPTDDEQRLVYVLTHLDSTDDRNACWAGRMFFGSITQLDQPYRGNLTRTFMTSKNN